jgi:hypothetical protein
MEVVALDKSHFVLVEVAEVLDESCLILRVEVEVEGLS